jgi:hypothetical protein
MERSTGALLQSAGVVALWFAERSMMLCNKAAILAGRGLSIGQV